MQVIEHQYLHYNNVLIYETEVVPETILGVVNGIPDSLSVLGLQLNGKIILTYKGNCMEFIIPVNEGFPSNQHYWYKPEFKLVNAVRARHYGSFLNIGNKVEELYAYIAERSLQAMLLMLVQVLSLITLKLLRRLLAVMCIMRLVLAI